MTTRLLTVSGSIYELDREGKRVRRLFGLKTATSRQGQDGDWKHYEQLVVAENGLFFDWDGEGHGTMTSPIVSEAEVS